MTKCIFVSLQSVQWTNLQLFHSNSPSFVHLHANSWWPWWCRLVPYLFMLSKAFLKSMKFIMTGRCHAVTFSSIRRKTNIWSSESSMFLSQFAIDSILHSFKQNAWKTLPGTHNSVIPLQLLQSVRSPFFGSGIMIPFFQSDGTVLLSHVALHNSVNSGIIASEYSH